jgi:hypothetical protein
VNPAPGLLNPCAAMLCECVRGLRSRRGRELNPRPVRLEERLWNRQHELRAIEVDASRRDPQGRLTSVASQNEDNWDTVREHRHASSDLESMTALQVADDERDERLGIHGTCHDSVGFYGRLASGPARASTTARIRRGVCMLGPWTPSSQPPIIGIASAAIGSAITGLAVLVIDERRRKDERARWAKDDERREREHWLDRRRELYADIAGQGQSLAMLASLVSAGYRWDARDWFQRLDAIFRVATEIRLVGGARMSKPAGELVLAANAMMQEASRRRTGPRWILHRLLGIGEDSVDSALSAPFNASLRDFVETAAAPIRPRASIDRRLFRVLLRRGSGSSAVLPAGRPSAASGSSSCIALTMEQESARAATRSSGSSSCGGWSRAIRMTRAYSASASRGGRT